jgi:aspartate aminotransferase-like enzyme
MLYRITDGLKQVFHTENDIFVLTSSGTGAMEAAVANTLSPGEKVLCASIGSFGDRFGKIASVFGADVTRLNFPQGTAVVVDELRRVLDANPEITSVLVTHNETNTGVTNDLEPIARVVKGEFDKLLLVDGISSVCSLPLKTDEWDLDVVATASQKGWMLPPGLAFISMSERAWAANEKSTMPRFYFNLSEYKRYFDMGQPPWTPNLSAMYALDYALTKIVAEGVENVWKRHADIAQMTRDGIRALGLEVFPDDSVASNTVTAVKMPEGVDADELRKHVLQDHNVVLAGAYGELTGKMFRIGHLGYVSTEEIEQMLDAIKASLPKVGIGV